VNDVVPPAKPPVCDNPETMLPAFSEDNVSKTSDRKSPPNEKLKGMSVKLEPSDPGRPSGTITD